MAGQVDFYGMLSGLGDTIAAQRKEAARRQAFADINRPDGTADFQKAVLGLAQAGDVEGATRLSQLAGALEDRKFRQSTDARDFAFRQSEAQRAQANADRENAFRVKQAEREKYTIKEIEDPVTGVKTLQRVKTEGPEGPIGGPAPSGGASAGNPFGFGKFNNEQGKAAGFTDRMLQSEGILSGRAAPAGQEGPPVPGVQNEGTSFTQANLSRIPLVGNYLTGKDRQRYEQAKRDFINAQLRRESGAAISASEFENADKQYFPVPGDERNPEVIAQKQANRRAAIEAMGREGGPSYRPKATFGAEGTITPVAQPSAAPAPNRPISKEQYDALPSGSTFIAPDGSRRVKP